MTCPPLSPPTAPTPPRRRSPLRHSPYGLGLRDDRRETHRSRRDLCRETPETYHLDICREPRHLRPHRAHADAFSGSRVPSADPTGSELMAMRAVSKTVIRVRIPAPLLLDPAIPRSPRRVEVPRGAVRRDDRGRGLDRAARRRRGDSRGEERTLSEPEREYARSVIDPLTRWRWVADHGWRRRLLGCLLEIAPDQVAFTVDEHGRPDLDGTLLSFSASRSAAGAVYAVSPGATVGVDVEALRDGVGSRCGSRAVSSRRRADGPAGHARAGPAVRLLPVLDAQGGLRQGCGHRPRGSRSPRSRSGPAKIFRRAVETSKSGPSGSAPNEPGRWQSGRGG